MRLVYALVMAAGLAAALPANAKTVTVQMKDKGADGSMVFEPAFVRAAPGDTIHFVPTSGGHNAETIATMLPAGVAPTKGQMGQPFDLKVTTPGLYGVKCLPHYSMGMVALVQVGPASAASTQMTVPSMPPFAKTRMAKYLAQVK